VTLPTGLLLAAGELLPDHVADALNDQGGPSWDKTIFRLLTGVDVAALAADAPAAGKGTAVSLASSGWWLRDLDVVAARLAVTSGQSILAVFECLEPKVSGWHLAHANGTSERRVSLGETDQWGAGVVRLTDGPALTAASLSVVAGHVHGNDPEGADVPGLFNLTSDPARPDEWAALLEVRGAALAAGLRWRPGAARDPQDEPPERMRVLLLQSHVRLPGPPGWARATRAVAIRTAEEALRSDGWVCLVANPGGEPAEYGVAVRVLQLAPLADGSAIGLLHARCAVHVTEFEGGLVRAEPVPQDDPPDAPELARMLALVVDRIRSSHPKLPLVEADLAADPDPASRLGGRLDLDPAAETAYLAAGGPVARLRVLADFLAR